MKHNILTIKQHLLKHKAMALRLLLWLLQQKHICTFIILPFIWFVLNQVMPASAGECLSASGVCNTSIY